MHDERLGQSIKQAGEAFEPPWVDVRTVVRRGRRRWWVTRPAVAAATLALVAGAALAVSDVELGGRATPATPASGLTRWEPIAAAPIEGRTDAAAAWTGSELIVWGGYEPGQTGNLADGAAYDPATDTWEELPKAPGDDLGGESAVWTGRELLVWGGETAGRDFRERGKAFDPDTRRWRSFAGGPYWSLGSHTAVWTGTEMLVWGGVPSERAVGAAYDPATDEWETVPQGPLGSRHGHEAVWTGSEMVVWGGLLQSGANIAEGPDAAAYDPETRTWRTLPDAPLDPAHAAVSFWTGQEVVIAGGLGDRTAARSGAAYDPAENRWRSIAEIPPAAERDGAPIPLTDLGVTPVWTGREAVFVTADGVLSYLPEDDRWVRAPAPRDAWRMGATAVWTGDELIVWSGRTWDDTVFATGGWRAGR